MFGERYIVHVVLYVLYVAFWLKRAEYRGGSSDWLDVVVIGWRWVGMSGQICSPPSPATILYCVYIPCRKTVAHIIVPSLHF